MREYGFSLTRVFPYKDRIVNSGVFYTVLMVIKIISQALNRKLNLQLKVNLNDSVKLEKLI